MAYIQIKDSAGNTIRLLATADGSSPANYSVHHYVDDVVPGTRATKLGKAEDAAHTSADVGVMALAVRTDTAAARAGTDGDYIPLIVDASGRLHVNIGAICALAAGTNMIGGVNLVPATSGGCDTYRNIDLDETGQLIHAGACQLYGIFIVNAAAAKRYVKIYDHVDAPAVGTDPIAQTYEVTASSNLSVPIPGCGVALAAGLGIGATTGLADNDTGAPAANDVMVHVFYKH